MTARNTYNPPAWLCSDGKTLFLALRSEVEPSNASAHLLAILVKAYLQYQDASAAIDRQGQVITSATGAVKKNPWVDAQKQQSDTILKIAKELGITPATKEALASGTFDPLTEFEAD